MAIWVNGSLDAEQEAAIAEPGNVFLVACPGSGKTRTLTHKVAEELEKLESHRRFVAAITYTHRAADEIEERISELGGDTTQLWIGTIHSFCLEWIIKPYGTYHRDLARGYQVVNSHETEAILERLCVGYKNASISVFDCDYYFTDTGMELGCRSAAKLPGVKEILTSYFDQLKAARQIDYEHILKYAFELIRDNPAISSVLSQLFSFIAIDEYQDTKQIQYSILGSIVRAGTGGTRVFVVGDPNQSIFTSLGGYAIDPGDFRRIINAPLKEMALTRNYRSSSSIVDYFSHYSVVDSPISAASPDAPYASAITFDNTTDRGGLEAEIARLIRHNVEVLGIRPSEICVVAPWWIHLAHLTRKLVALMPEYQFDGPGLVPFSRDVDNFWFKIARLALTDADPRIYTTRLRWADDVINDLHGAGVDTFRLTRRVLLRESNSISLSEVDGLEYLRQYYERLFAELRIDFRQYETLRDQYQAFFDSSRVRVDRLVKEGVPYVSDIAMFRRVFRQRAGITVSTIHGVKGAEFDTVIAFALLEGMVPHFSDNDQTASAKKLLYVIGSRARKNLHLIAERGRTRGGGRPNYDTAVPLRKLRYDYGSATR